MKVSAGLKGLSALAAVGLVTAGCGSNSSDTAGSAGDEIKVMAIGVMQSSAVSFPDMKAAATAAAEAINADGGINGKKLKVEFCNDKYDPNTAISCARKAVSDHVVAVTEPYEPFSDQVEPILSAAKIPIIYNTLAGTTDGTSEISFPRDAGVPGKYAAIGYELGKGGCAKVGAVVVSDAVNQLGADWLKKGVAAGGAQFVSTSVSADQADFNAPVAKLISEGADCIVPDTKPDQGAKIATAIQQSGKPIKIGALTAEYGVSAIKQLGPALDGTILVDFAYQPTDTSVSAVEKVVTDMKKYTPDTPLDDFVGISAYGGIDALAQVIEKTQGDVTAESVLKAAQTTTVDTGLEAPISWTKPGPFSQYPRVSNWDYLVWKVQGGAATLAGSTFQPLPTSLGK